MNTEKYISGIKTKVQQKIDKLRDEASEAYGCWADTGYQRYMNKKDRLETEANQLEAFIHPNYEIREVRRQLAEEKQKREELKLLFKNVCNVVEDEMKYDFPDCHATRRLDDIVNKFKFEHLNR